LATSSDPTSVNSHSSCVITLASCPVPWSSKLQMEITLSTTGEKYIVLPQSTQDLFLMCYLLHELTNATKSIVGSTIAHSTVFEDNKGCVERANTPKMHP
jgi:hypothetical protein